MVWAIPVHTTVVNVVGEITTLVTSAGLADGIWSRQWAKGGILRIMVWNR